MGHPHKWGSKNGRDAPMVFIVLAIWLRESMDFLAFCRPPKTVLDARQNPRLISGVKMAQPTVQNAT